MGISVSRSTLGLGEVLALHAAWSNWLDVRNLQSFDLSPQGTFTADISLRSPLGIFGTEIHLPLDRQDYAGQPAPAIRRFVDQLEQHLAGRRAVT